MEKLTLTQVYRTDKDKKGALLVTKDGRNYTRLGVKAKEHGDKWLSGFGNSKNSGWKEGDQVEVIVEQKGEYLNFSMPKETDALEQRVSQLEADVKALLAFINVAKIAGDQPPDVEPEPEETPF